MTFDHRYRDRLAAIGSEIDRELAMNASVSVRQSVSGPINFPNEVMLGCQLVNDGNNVIKRDTSWISAPMIQPTLLDVNYLLGAPFSERSSLISTLSESHLKILFQESCRLGESEISELVLSEWTRRLTNITDHNSGHSCLLNYVLSKNPVGTELLLDNGADIFVKTPLGESLLHVAVGQGCTETLQVLLNHIPPLVLGEELKKLNQEGVSVMNMSELSSPEIQHIIQAHFLIALSVEGNEAYRKGTFEEAVTKYSEAISVCYETESDQRNDNLVKLEYNCARGLFRLGRWRESIVHCTRCLELDPSYVNALSQRAQSQFSLADYDSAKKDYELLIALLCGGQSSGEDEAGKVRQLNEYRLKLIEVEKNLKVDHYSVLEIDRFSSEHEVKAAFRQLAKRFHPDKVMGEPEDIRARSRNQFERMQKAYSALTCDPLSKEDYDMHLRIQMSTEAVRESILQRRYSVGGEKNNYSSKLRRSYDVLFRN